MKQVKKLAGLTLALGSLSIICSCSSIGYKAGLADCAPVYGNWCGENYPSHGYNPRPVDAWDNACRNHDKCYDRDENKEYCDRKFVEELEYLSRYQLAPTEMYNAHSWFLPDGWFGGNSNLSDEIWSIGASCEGGDGRATQFSCLVNQFTSCNLNPKMGAGRAGLYCNCNGFTGVIVEY